MEIVKVKIEELKPAEYNPRAMTEKETIDLTESIKRFGLVEPIVVNGAPERKNVIIGGHQRFFIARKLGFAEIPVVYVNLPDIKKEKELNLRLNRNLGHWDYELLANFEEKTLIDVGFSNEELDQIFGLEEIDEFDEKKEFEKAIKNPRGVKTGDVWQLGNHRLIIGDCTNQENWQKLLGAERFDFMFTDPPYRLAYCKKRTRKVKTKEGFKLRKQKEYNMVSETDYQGKKKGFDAKQNRIYQDILQRGVPEYDEWLSLAQKFQNPNGANIMIFENWRNVHDLWEAIEKYWKIHNMIIWHLPNRMQGFSAPHKFFNKYDVAPLAGEGILNEEYEKELEDYLRDKGQKLLDSYEVILYAKNGNSEWSKKKGTKWAKINDHITWVATSGKSGDQNIIFGTKPIQILVPYLKILSPQEGIIMEPFGGSGSTLIAAEIMKRKCRVIEISETYAEVIIGRWEKFTGQKAEKIADNNGQMK